MNPKTCELGCKLFCLCLSITAALASFSTIVLIPEKSALDVISFAFGAANTAMAIWMTKEVIKVWRRN